MGTLKTRSPVYHKKDNCTNTIEGIDLILDARLQEYTQQAFYTFNAFR